MRTPNRDILMGKWRQLKGQVRKEWGRLTSDQIEQIGGSYERLVGVLQERYGHLRQTSSQQTSRLLNDRFSKEKRHPR